MNAVLGPSNKTCFEAHDDTPTFAQAEACGSVLLERLDSLIVARAFGREVELRGFRRVLLKSAER